MGHTYYLIELYILYEEDGKHEVILDACRDAARTLFVSASMLAEPYIDGGKPVASIEVRFGSELSAAEDKQFAKEMRGTKRGTKRGKGNGT